MPDTTEFAEQYTRAERLRLVLLILPAAIALLLAARLYFFPWLAAFAASAACRQIGGVNGTSLLMYGLFVGTPLLAALAASLAFGLPGYKILRDGQFPPAGAKVFRPTRIRRGRSAALIGAAHLLPLLLLLAIAAWGGFQAGAKPGGAQTRPADCAAILAAPGRP